MRNNKKNYFLKEKSIALNDLFDIFSEKVDGLEIESNIIKNINLEIIFI